MGWDAGKQLFTELKISMHELAAWSYRENYQTYGFVSVCQRKELKEAARTKYRAALEKSEQHNRNCVECNANPATVPIER